MIMDVPIAIFGDVAASYVVLPITENTCRLVQGHVLSQEQLLVMDALVPTMGDVYDAKQF